MIIKALKGSAKSKTMWVGVVTTILAHSDVITQVADAIGTPGLVTGVSVMFMILRAVSTDGLLDKVS